MLAYQPHLGVSPRPQGEPCLMKRGGCLPRNDTQGCAHWYVLTCVQAFVHACTRRDHFTISTTTDFRSLMNSMTPHFCARSTLQALSILFLRVRFLVHELWGYTRSHAVHCIPPVHLPQSYFPLILGPDWREPARKGLLNALLETESSDKPLRGQLAGCPA